MKLIAVVILALVLWDCGKKPVPRPSPTPTPTSTPTPSPTPTPEPLPTPPVIPSPSPTPTLFPSANRVHLGPSEDLGRAVGIAFKGPDIREVVVEESGVWSTQVVIAPGNRLRLAMGVTITTTTALPPILVQSGGSVVGAGWDTSTIVESTNPQQWTVIGAYQSTLRNGDTDSDILLTGFRIAGSPGHPFYSAPQAISLGNCKRCKVERVWIDGTHSIGIQLGGAGFLGHAAEDSAVVHCRFTRVASQSLALVNGRRIELSYNHFSDTGQPGGPGSHPIDVELNGSEDVAHGVNIRANYIDLRNAVVNGNGIIVQVTTGSLEIGDILVEGNVLIGGNIYPPATNWMSNGIYVFGTTAQNVTINNNRIWRTGLSGIRVEGAGMVVTNNELVNVGGGSNPGVYLDVVTSTERQSVFSHNTFRYLGGPADSRLVVYGNPVLEDNDGFELVRPTSR